MGAITTSTLLLSPELRGDRTTALDEQQPAADRFDLDRWLRVLRRRWWVILACMLLVGGSATAYSLTRQKQYTASASLLFNPATIGEEITGVNAPVSNDPARQSETNVKLVESTDVAIRTAAALGNRLTVQQITQKVTASAEGQSDFVSVSAQDPRPSFAARLANTYAQQFIAFRRDGERASFTQARDSLQAQYNALTPTQQRSAAGQDLQTRIEQLNTLAAAANGDVSLEQPATPPTSPSYPKTKLNIAVGLVLGLLLGLGLALLMERLNRRIRGVDELGQIYGLPILAEVPESGKISRDGVTGVATAATYETASFEMLRARLRYFSVDRVRSLLVTSCAPQEGKTTVAWHLAQATAVSTHGRVLLIEADLRRPSLARTHRLEFAPGLSDVLSGQLDYIEAIQEVAVPTLANGDSLQRSIDVIVAGPIPPNPAELVESRAMTDLIARASEAYEFVVVDSGPALVVPDALALMSQVAGVLVVSHMGGTTRDAAAQLRDQLDAVNAPVVGVVANRVKGAARSGYYYTYSSTADS